MKIPVLYQIERYIRDIKSALKLQEEFRKNKPIVIEQADTSEFQFSDQAIKKLLSGEYKFETVLDIGCGAGEHSNAFLKAGKKVTAIDYGDSIYFKNNKDKLNVITDDFNQYVFTEQFDCVWCSHILEHQPNTEQFLKKIISLTKEDGIIAITIPNLQNNICGGHIRTMNLGELLYNLVFCGVDCSGAKMKAYGMNRSLILRKKLITDMPKLSYDCGDIKKLWNYFPQNLEKIDTGNDYHFNGDIIELNWDN